MSTNAHYHPRQIDIDLSELPSWLYTEIVSLHGHIDPPPAPPVLTCRGNGQPMYIWRHQSRRYFARHYPGGNSDNHSHFINTMSIEHHRQAEYVARAASKNGLEAVLEMLTGGGTRIDVGVTGENQIGFEIQRSQLSRAHAKSRCTKSFNAGWPTAWVHDQEKEPDWVGHVPTARLTVRSDWAENLPPSNTAKVIIRRFSRERDANKKSGWRYEHGPTEVLLDDLAYLMPAGEIVPVTISGKQKIVVLAYKGASEIIDSCTYPGASNWEATTKTPRTKESVQTISRPCRHGGADPEVHISRPWRYEVEANYPPVISTDPLPASSRCPGCERMKQIQPCFFGCDRRQP